MASVTITFEMLSKLSAGAKAELMALISGEMSADPVNVDPVNMAPANELVLPDLLEFAEAPLAAAVTIPLAEVMPGIPAFFKLILSSGKAVGVKEEGATAPLRAVEVIKGQVFKAIPISSGPHTGFLELEAVGGRQAGKILDNSAKKNASIVLYRRCLTNNAAQRWKFLDGKLSSAVSGMFMAKGDSPGFGFSESGDIFTLLATEPPVVAEAPAAAASRASSPSRTVNNHFTAEWSLLPFGPDGTVRIKTTYKGEELFGFCSGPKRFSDEAGVLVATSLNKFAQRLRGERAVDAWTCCYYLDRDGSWKSMHAIRTRIAAE